MRILFITEIFLSVAASNKKFSIVFALFMIFFVSVAPAFSQDNNNLRIPGLNDHVSEQDFEELRKVLNRCDHTTSAACNGNHFVLPQAQQLSFNFKTCDGAEVLCEELLDEGFILSKNVILNIDDYVCKYVKCYPTYTKFVIQGNLVPVELIFPKPVIFKPDFCLYAKCIDPDLKHVPDHDGRTESEEEIQKFEREEEERRAKEDKIKEEHAARVKENERKEQEAQKAKEEAEKQEREANNLKRDKKEQQNQTDLLERTNPNVEAYKKANQQAKSDYAVATAIHSMAQVKTREASEALSIQEKALQGARAVQEWDLYNIRMRRRMQRVNVLCKSGMRCDLIPLRVKDL